LIRSRIRFCRGCKQGQRSSRKDERKPLGRQTQLHMLDNDVRELVNAVGEKCDLVVTRRYDDVPMIKPVTDPATEHIMTLWNRDLQPALQRSQIRLNDGGEWFHIDSRHQVIELSNYAQTTWNGRPGLVQGRIYGMDFSDRPAYAKWFDSVQRWVRKNFHKAPRDIGFVGPEAWRFFEAGGILLPGFSPPVTPAWLEEIARQDAGRLVMRQAQRRHERASEALKLLERSSKNPVEPDDELPEGYQRKRP